MFWKESKNFKSKFMTTLTNKLKQRGVNIKSVIFLLTMQFVFMSNGNGFAYNYDNLGMNENESLEGGCSIQVDLGPDRVITKGEKLTLTANITNPSSCSDCKKYKLKNTKYCKGNEDYVVWLSDGHFSRWFSNINLVWIKLDNGTARLRGKVFDQNGTQSEFYVNVLFSGLTSRPPAGSPKEHFCHYEDPSDWKYYKKMSGTIKQVGGTYTYRISRRGPAFQIGTGANSAEAGIGVNGGSGWFNTTDPYFKIGDFNINLGKCIKTGTGASDDVTYLWSNGATTPTIEVSPEDTTVYTLQVQGCDGCTTHASVKVTVEEENELEVDAGDDQEICKGESTRLSANAMNEGTCRDCTSYNLTNTKYCKGSEDYVVWLSDGHFARWFSNVDLVWTTFDNGTATLKGKVFDQNGTQSHFDVDVLFSGLTTTPPAGSPKEHFCHYENPTGWEYYTEMSGAIRQTGGTYTYHLSRRGPAFQIGTGANSAEARVGVDGGSGWFNTTDPYFKIGDFNINLGDCIQSNPGSNELKYLWSNGATTTTIEVSPLETTVYTVEVIDCAGNTASDDVKVTVNTSSADAGSDQEICLGDSVVITAADADTYLWSTGETTQSIVVVPTETTEYTLTVTTNDCEATDKVIVVVNDASVDAGDDREICLGDSAVLVASEGADTYLWSTGETTQTIEVSPTETTEYTVTITTNGCEATDEVIVTVYTATTDAGDDQEICLGESVMLTAAEADTYLWSTGEITQSIEVSPIETTTYTVTVTKDSCYAIDEVIVYVYDASVVLEDDQVICEGSTITLVATGTGSFEWSTGETAQTIEVSPIETTTYTVVATDGTCSATDSITVTVTPSPSILIEEDITICKGEEITLSPVIENTGACVDCVDYVVVGTDYCRGDHDFVVWLTNKDRSDRRWYSNIDLVWNELPDGSARLTGTIFDYTVTQSNYEVDVTYYGKTFEVPSGSPKEHFCNDEDITGWAYYTSMSGTITKEDGSEVFNLTRRGASFQLGNGANVYETEEAVYGGSGWFDITEGDFAFGDFNINLGECLTPGVTSVDYEWSTGATTPTLTVAPETTTTYELTVKNCEDCVTTKSITVNVDNCNVISKQVKLYPTQIASAETVSVNFDSTIEENVTIAVFNSAGMQVGYIQNEKVQKGNNTMHITAQTISSLKVGFYLVKIIGSNWSETKRVIVH